MNLIKNEKSTQLTITFSELYSVDQALERLKNLFGTIIEWTSFLNLIPKFSSKKIINKSIVSSNFVATLELTKNGYLELKQNDTFEQIYIRAKE